MASKFVDTPCSAIRFMDTGNEPRRRMVPLKGFEKLNIRSLDKAIQPLIEKVSDIQHMAYNATEDSKEFKIHHCHTMN
jgi:hypothetical protein